MVVIPLASMVLSNMTSMVGWGASPYNPFWASRHPKRYAIMSLAGPCANILLAVIAFTLLVGMSKSGVFVLSQMPSFDTLVMPLGDEAHTPLGALARVLSVMFSLNVLLAIFNLLPVPPLDGAAVIEGLWPDRVGAVMAKVRETPMFGILGLVVVWQVVPYVVTPVWVSLVIFMHQL
jgi:Zn-dependent protease